MVFGFNFGFLSGCNGDLCMKKPYKYHKPGEWIRPIRRGYKLACCDCGLVHVINFRVRKRHVEFQTKRDDRATGQIRRHIKKGRKNV
jgi:hypothetical protein